jgi:hypothetical protein
MNTDKKNNNAYPRLSAAEYAFFLNLLAWSFDDFFLRNPQAVRQAVDFR